MTLAEYMKDFYHQTINIVESPAMKGFNFCIVDKSMVFVSPAIHECLSDDEIFKTTVENLECRFLKTTSFTQFEPIKKETVRGVSGQITQMIKPMLPVDRQVTSEEIINMAKKFSDAYQQSVDIHNRFDNAIQKLSNADPLNVVLQKAFTEGKDLYDWMYNTP